MKVLKFLSFALPTFVICCEKSFICQSCFGHVFSLKFAVYYERSQKYPPFWDLAGSHKRKFKINFDKFWKEKRKEFWWILMKFASARSRRYRRNFENFLHREWELIEILQKLQKNFFFEKFFEVEKLDQNCIFRTLSEDFSAFFNRCCGNFESLGRDGGVFYPKVKRESKNSSIQPRTSRGKTCDF